MAFPQVHEPVRDNMEAYKEAAAAHIPKVISLVLVLFWLVSLIPGAVEVFGLVPIMTFGRTMYLWNVLTCGFFETNILAVAFNVVTLNVMGRFLETSWSALEFVRFVVVVNSLSGICTLFTFYLFFLVLRFDFFLFDPIYGFHACSAGFAVVAKQLKANLGPLTYQYIPFVYLTGSILLMILFGMEQLICFVVYGFIFSWFYLRYYQPKENGARGDSQDDFSFETLLPPQVHPLFRPIINIVYGTIGKHIIPAPYTGPLLSTQKNISVLGTDEASASRRRQRALQALEERMAGLPKEEDISLDGGDVEMGSTADIDTTAAADAPEDAKPSAPSLAEELDIKPPAGGM